MSSILSENYSYVVQKAKEISQSEEQSSIDSDAHYKKEVSSHSDNTIETRIRDPLVERLNRHRNELLKQNPIPRNFLEEPAISQINTLYR